MPIFCAIYEKNKKRGEITMYKNLVRVAGKLDAEIMSTLEEKFAEGKEIVYISTDWVNTGVNFEPVIACILGYPINAKNGDVLSARNIITIVDSDSIESNAYEDT